MSWALIAWSDQARDLFPHEVCMFLQPADWTCEDNNPAIVFYFGGGWVGESPNHFSSQAQHYADLGLVTVLADYRVASRNKTTVMWP